LDDVLDDHEDVVALTFDDVEDEEVSCEDDLDVQAFLVAEEEHLEDPLGILWEDLILDSVHKEREASIDSLALQWVLLDFPEKAEEVVLKVSGVLVIQGLNDFQVEVLLNEGALNDLREVRVAHKEVCLVYSWEDKLDCLYSLHIQV
jgi:hypothetical protein